jgi:putative PIN family toxin of toxin-antitoxin system
MKVFLDTNVLVAAFATRGICEDVLRTTLTEHELLVGKTVLVELERVLAEKLRMPSSKSRSIVSFLRSQATVIEPVAPALWPKADPDDQWILAAAIKGGADVLVTGDADLVDIADEAPMSIVSPRGFWERLK